MRLAEFILANVEPILAEWEEFARSLLPGKAMTRRALRDDAEGILRATARDMQIVQSLPEQTSKSKGHGGAGGEASDRLDAASALHGVGRAGSAFGIMDVVAEYRALRASVLRLWRESLPQPNRDDIDDITRFNESLDQSLAISVERYSGRIEESRQMFLAILSDDLRNPLACIRLATHLMSGKQDESASVDPLSMIETNTAVMTRLIGDLIDFASSALGRPMPLKRGPVDLGALCSEVIDGYRITNPRRELHLRAEGVLRGWGDAARLRQVLSNLVGNAVQYGSPEAPVEVSMVLERSPGRDATLVISVHNEGAPIPPECLPTIFDPLVRHATRESLERRNPTGMGLGLHIAREIVVAKGGTLEVTSTAHAGTTFTVRIPRFVRAENDDRADATAAG